MTDDRPPLDFTRIAAGTLPLQLVLAGSTAFGVALGIGIIFFAMAMSLVTVPILGLPIAAAVVGSQATNLIVLGAAAMIAIPLAATFAANLKCHYARQNFVSMYGLAVQNDADPLQRAVSLLAQRAGMTYSPLSAWVKDAVNAFAIGGGPGTSLVAIGSPLKEILTGSEIGAVIGHELGHIALQDSRRKLLALAHQEFLVRFLVFGGIRTAARWFFTFVSELMLLGLSRNREFWADAVGAYLTSTEDMIAALQKLSMASAAPTQLEKQYTQLMFRPDLSRWLSTHPTYEKRIQALSRGTYIQKLPVHASFSGASNGGSERVETASYADI